MASNRIKGLTIEIGGDTTKLGKALQDVDAKSRNLSSELGDINRLLKLDPSNTELLAQKQKILTEAISNTGKRLETLKESERQVQEQFERGEASEEQVRALKREIVATEQKMQRYQDAAEETAQQLHGMDQATEKVEKSSGKLSNALKAGAKAGLAAVTGLCAASITGLTAAAESSREYRTEQGKLQTAFKEGNFAAEDASNTYKALNGILGDSGQAVEAASHLAKLTDNQEDLSTWTDICTGVYATFGDSLPIENLTEAANETAKTGALTGGLADALNWAGVNEADFQKQLEACSTEQERQALITDTLNGLYSEAADSYREVNGEVIRANEANDLWMQSVAGVGAAIDPVITDVKMFGGSLVADLVPGVQATAEAFRGVAEGVPGAANQVGVALSDLMVQLLDKIVQLAPALMAVAASLISTLLISLVQQTPAILETVIQIIMQTVDTLSSMLPTIVTTIVGIIPVLINTLLAQVPQLLQTAITLLGTLIDAIPVVITQLVEALPGVVTTIINVLVESIPLLLDAAIMFLMSIVDALPTIVDSLVAALPMIIDTVVTALVENGPVLLDAAINFFMAIISALPTIIQSLVTNLPRISITVCSSLVSNLPRILQAAVEMFMGVVKAIPKIVSELVRNIPSIVTAVVNGLKSGISSVFHIGQDLVRGLWNGINDMKNWVLDKVKGFGGFVLNGIKSIFDIHSPSKKTAWMGKMLDEGLANGILDNASAPVDAMDQLAGDLFGEADGINGLTLERRMQHTLTAVPENMVETASLGDKLDRILEAINRGSVILLDGKTLVGQTAAEMDAVLGKRRMMTARGTG